MLGGEQSAGGKRQVGFGVWGSGRGWGDIWGLGQGEMMESWGRG